MVVIYFEKAKPYTRFRRAHPNILCFLAQAGNAQAPSMLAGASSSNVDASNARSFGAFPGAQTQQGINNAFPFATGSHGA